MNILETMQKRSKLLWVAIGVILIVLVGYVDYLTGYEYAFSLFYLIPITLIVWFAGRNLGLIASLFSAAAWLTADIYAGSQYTKPLVYVWNTIIRLIFFVVVTLLLSIIKRLYEREKEFATTDSLTGAVNGRTFLNMIQNEIERSSRTKRPFTLVYFDLDNFKEVNDQFGHSTGDQVLVTIVDRLREQIRKIDRVARMGGDEFALLLPETDAADARLAIPRMQANLLAVVKRNDWSVTFSIGVITCSGVQSTPDDLIKRADELMYRAKKNGKNSIQFNICTG